eukprot:COSAG06_NODE_2159_length_7447_cov_792.064235_4_plen_127_part_00
MAKMSKAECSKAGKALVKNGTSAAGKKLAHCRWHKNKKPAGTKKPKAKPKAAPAARKSRRIAGLTAETVRQPEPKKKPRKKAKKKKVGGRSSAGLKKIENKLVPGLNPPPGDMKNFLAQQMRLYGV